MSKQEITHKSFKGNGGLFGVCGAMAKKNVLAWANVTCKKCLKFGGRLDG